MKYWAICGIALTLAACSDDSFVTPNGGGTAEVSDFNTATMTVRKSTQTRATSLGTWSETHEDNWISYLNFKKPADATPVTNDNPKLTGNRAYYVSSDFTKTLDFDNFNGDLYVDATITSVSGNLGTMNLYILENGSWECGTPNGTTTVYNQGGKLILPAFDGSKIKTIYNSGYMAFGTSNQQLVVPNEVSIYSCNGDIDIYGNDIMWNAFADIHSGTLNAYTSKLTIQNANTTKYFCGIEVRNGDDFGELYINEKYVTTSYIKAKTITFNGHPIYLLPEAHVIATEKISMSTNATNDVFYGYTDSHALIETKDFYFRNKCNFQDSFTENIYFNVTGKIDIEELIEKDNGNGGTYTANETNTYNSITEYLQSQNGATIANRFNADIAGTPACGASYGSTEPEQTVGPKLVPIGNIEAPEHDHNADKTKGYRHLSATCIDFADDVFYVSYHMRGSNYANDTYNKDEDEGCIETWTIQTVKEDVEDDEGNVTGTKETKKIKLGNYMWTNEFDFNHLIIDGNQIVTVGHKQGVKEDGTSTNFGAIIGKLSTEDFKNFNAANKEGEEWVQDYTTPQEFNYKYLKTEQEVKDWYKNESSQGNTTYQLVDHKNAGDGNCVIKVGKEYWVATYEGYGKVDAEFNRIEKDGQIAFHSTAGSAKHIIDMGDNVAVLYLNERTKPITAKTEYPATLATLSKEAFPFATSVTKTLTNMVKPVDGKNVIAWNGVNLFACLGKGGLSVNNATLTTEDTYNFGAEEEPVNGIAIDGEYIYLASGSHLRVLKSTTLEEVTHYCIPYMSANYIKVATIDGEKYIAVAFGQAGIKVFKLVENN